MDKSSPGSPSDASKSADPDAVHDFVAEVAVVAGSIDPMLAVILGSGLEPVSEQKRWNRGRRNGLEFCLVMLGHARRESPREVDARRIDRAISYIILEFARLHHVREPIPAI